MKNNPILTIVVPSYNTSKYVDECLPTFCDERLINKIRVVLIDDGATDDTAEKIKRYTSKYPQIFSFFHKENGGHGSVINFAVFNLVSTRYFKVIDGDDWTDPSILLDFTTFLYGCDCDLVVNDYVNVYQDKQVYQNTFCPGAKDKYLNYHISIHSVTFRTDIFLKHNIRVREHVFYEDNEFVLFPLEYVKSIGYFNKPVYYYRLGNSNQSVSFSSMMKRIGDYLLVKDDVVEKYKMWINGSNNELIAYTEYSLCCFYSWIIECFLLLKKSRNEFIEVKKEIQTMHIVKQKLEKIRIYHFVSSFNFRFLRLKRHLINRYLKRQQGE